MFFFTTKDSTLPLLGRPRPISQCGCSFWREIAIFFPPCGLFGTREYTLRSAQGIQLSCKVPFVKFQWLVLELLAANQRVSNCLTIACYFKLFTMSNLVSISIETTILFCHQICAVIGPKCKLVSASRYYFKSLSTSGLFAICIHYTVRFSNQKFHMESNRCDFATCEM